MKKTFPGHFPPTHKEIVRLWEECVFTLDANILLNLYRYSDSTRNEFVKVLRALKNRLWLPHRAAQEFFENRLKVISQQEKAYDEALKTIQVLQTDLSNARQHPFLSDNLMKKLTQVLGEAVGELTTTKATHANRTSTDEIQRVISDLFNGRVGSPYSEEQLEEICREGEGRYARKIPPGYKDDSKDESDSPTNVAIRKYGDLVIWRQLAEHATQAKKGIIFINDDKKEDWYLIFRGKTIGPRPELIEEFLSKTGQLFHMYQADRFFELAAKQLEQKITPESMDEIREIRDLRKRDLDRQVEFVRRRDDKLNVRDKVALQKEEMNLRMKERILRSKLSDKQAEMEHLQEKALGLKHELDIYREILDRSRGEDHEGLEKFTETERQVADMNMVIAGIREEMKAFMNEYEMVRHSLIDLRRINEQVFGHIRD